MGYYGRLTEVDALKGSRVSGIMLWLLVNYVLETGLQEYLCILGPRQIPIALCIAGFSSQLCSRGSHRNFYSNLPFQG